MADAKISSRSPWFWIPTLYVAEGMPYALAMSVSVVLYKNLGVSNTDIAFYTSWLYLPWVIKPLWSPVVDCSKPGGSGFG
jgi:PAT family beta-lactamase induction signal transducer AmpG